MDLFKEYKNFRKINKSNVSFDTWCKDELLLLKMENKELMDENTNLKEEIFYLNEQIKRLLW